MSTTPPVTPPPLAPGPTTRWAMRWGGRVWWLVVLPPFAVGIVLTVARAWQPSTAVGERWVAAAPYAVPVYLFVIVMCLWRALFPRRRAAWLAFVFALMLPLGVHLWWLSPLALGPNPAPDRTALPIVVMQLNSSAGEADPRAVVQAVVAHDVDVLVMEGVTPDFLADLQRVGLPNALSQSAGTPGDETQGTMVFSRFSLSLAQPIPTVSGSWRLTVTTPESSLDLVAATLPSLARHDEWRSDHTVVLASADGADLLVGDFQLTADHARYADYTSAGWRSAGERINAGWRPTWSIRTGWPLLLATDHVFVGEAYAVTTFRTVPIAGSDHAAVIATVAAK